MFQAKFQLTGDRELDRKFARLPEVVQRKVLRPALRGAAKMYQRAIQTEAPAVTGALAKSFKVRAAKRSRTNKGKVTVQARSDALEFKGDTFYGAFVHFGHRLGKRATRKKLRSPRRDRRALVEGNPFVKRAAQTVDASAKQWSLDAIRLGIEQAAAQ